MEKKALKITVLLLLSFLFSTQQLSCQEDSSIQWIFEPRTDGSVHVEAVVTLMESTGSYTFLEVFGGVWIKNVKAYEYESGDLIEHEVHYDSETRKQTITLNFNQPVPEPFVFGIKFDLMNFMEEKKEKVFIFEWWYRSEEERFHTAEVFLPKGAELLDLQYLEPARVEEGEQVIIYYEGKSKSYSDFGFLLAFSPSGKDYVKLAEHHEGKKDYDLAISYYQKAISIYSQYNYFAETNPEFLRELSQKTLAIQKIHADNTFEEATEAFEQGEYEEAKLQFEKAEPLYRVLKDTEKVSECEEMIIECEKILLEKEAETLFEQGKKQYESGDYTGAEKSFIQAKDKFEELGNTEKVSECRKMITESEGLGRFNEAETLLEQGKKQYKTFRYPWAKKSFIQAKDKFEELGNTEKVSECEEWLDKIEEGYRIILLCIFGAVAIFLAWWQRFH